MIRLYVLALSVCFAAVTTSETTLAQRIHPAEKVGIRSVHGDVNTIVRFVNRRPMKLKIYWLNGTEIS
jgi:hypothetical protein